MKYIPLLLTVFILSVIQVKAQNIKTSTIAWSSIKTMDASEGNSIDEVTTLTSYGTSKIEWKSSNGSLRKTYQVIEVLGEWTNVTNAGSIQYVVNDGTNGGTITFRKDADATRVLLVIVSDPAQVTELTIQNIQPQ